MNGTITQYMGTAYTGAGISHKYDEMIALASQTLFLKCPPTNAISSVLNEAAAHYVKQGYDIDRFMDPIQPEKTDAIYIKGPNVLILQASHPVALEPTDIGGKHKVISFYDVYDEVKLRELNGSIVKMLTESSVALRKALQALKDAKGIHDDWEKVNIRRMMWDLHVDKINSLKEELFGTIQLNKGSVVSHRLIGSLTSGGAQDFMSSITKRIDRRMLIKAFPGTGKSTLMKTLGAEAEKRGFDVQYGWCGLDPSGVDLVLFPELSVCILDATEPHVYDCERSGDELLDFMNLCEEDADAEEEIAVIRETYSEKMLDATGYMQSHAQAENSMKAMMDSTIIRSVFEKKTGALLNLI
ncbi:hypothetical protein [Sporosarcina sp. E16_8]|uniref:hypothetical protein n=1 Tax=Sporosarcina sp. E16_8 TaxID=2789295 RepID=UPI001A916D37|nr:hypothetical protein [Sporosarcina sp. E16_8]MBO0588794.1 hypothetical protein [Sporosarcina sp. E16_8]